MNQTDIKAAIVGAGTSQKAIAVHLGVSPVSVGRVIAGKMRSTRIEAELQKITGKPLHPTKPAPGRPATKWTGKLQGASV